MSDSDLAERVTAGDQRALARAITILDERRDGHRELLGVLHRVDRETPIIGVTGSPGTGKSTLVDRLISAYRERNLTVGVIGVDPTSPFSGGAILGDRIRMSAARGDQGVFIRSLSTQGTVGGLSPAVDDVLTAYEAFGVDRIVVETVGAGQNEIDIVRSAETVLVVVQPAQGDDVQLLKAGIGEIADIFVVNKADLDGVDRTVRQLTGMVAEANAVSGGADEWDPPILETVATSGEGIGRLLTKIDAHRSHLESTGRLSARRHQRYSAQLRRILQAELSARIDAWIGDDAGSKTIIEAIERRERDPYSVAEELLDTLTDSGRTDPGTR